jgi:hypothetical protein
MSMEVGVDASIRRALLAGAAVARQPVHQNLTVRRERVPDSSGDLVQHLNQCKASWVANAISPIDDDLSLASK